MSRNVQLIILLALFVLLMSVPYLVPGYGYLALIGFVPLLMAEKVASETGMRRFCLWHYSAFLAWNFATTFWICNATVGGGIFASVANAFQMSLIFGLFRYSKKYLRGSLPYIFLMVAWIAWERYYLTWAQISWPWLLLGNAFARSTSWIQWYEITGALGGSLWAWAMNLGIFGILSAVQSGRWKEYNAKAKTAAILGMCILFFGPLMTSLFLWPEPDKGRLDVYIAQPNIDPYNKFGGMTQEEQNATLLAQMADAPKNRPLLMLAPETFTNDVITNDLALSPTLLSFDSFLRAYPKANLIFGASSHEYIHSALRPSQTARRLNDGITWMESHNSALITDGTGRAEIYHKSKLVVGVEMMPYPAVFRHVDEWLGGVMGREAGQKEVSNLNFYEYDDSGSVKRTFPVGCAVCYESVYPEHCAEYVRKGAELLTVITNDAWWKNTPGYRQHLSYASLRAIETRRWIARCANTGISAVIDPAGKILRKTSWWQKETLHESVGLRDGQTFFVRHGDVVGRISVLCFLLLLLNLLVMIFTNRKIE